MSKKNFLQKCLFLIMLLSCSNEPEGSSDYEVVDWNSVVPHMDRRKSFILPAPALESFHKLEDVSKSRTLTEEELSKAESILLQALERAKSDKIPPKDMNRVQSIMNKLLTKKKLKKKDGRKGINLAKEVMGVDDLLKIVDMINIYTKKIVEGPLVSLHEKISKTDTSVDYEARKNKFIGDMKEDFPENSSQIDYYAQFFGDLIESKEAKQAHINSLQRKIKLFEQFFEASAKSFQRVEKLLQPMFSKTKGKNKPGPNYISFSCSIKSNYISFKTHRELMEEIMKLDTNSSAEDILELQIAFGNKMTYSPKNSG